MWQKDSATELAYCCIDFNFVLHFLILGLINRLNPWHCLLQKSFEIRRCRTALIFLERPIVLSRAKLGIWTCDSMFHRSVVCFPSDCAAAQVGLACVFTPFVHIRSCKFLLSRHELPITDDPRGSETTRSISHCCLLSVDISKNRLLR